jgi:hypothetical protein
MAKWPNRHNQPTSARRSPLKNGHFFDEPLAARRMIAKEWTRMENLIADSKRPLTDLKHFRSSTKDRCNSII